MLKIYGDTPAFLMNGCGNNFIVFDVRNTCFTINSKERKEIAKKFDCDQILLVKNGKQYPEMITYNADGSESKVCGNGIRCIAALLEKPNKNISIKAGSKILYCCVLDNNKVSVNMGQPCSSKILHTNTYGHFSKTACSMGYVDMENLHFVLFYSPHHIRLNKNKMEQIVQEAQKDVIFQDANISFVVIENKNSLTTQTWERGVGFTQCCGTAACSAFYLAHNQGFCSNETNINFPGGILSLQKDKNNDIIMTGHAALDKKIN